MIFAAATSGDGTLGWIFVAVIGYLVLDALFKKPRRRSDGPGFKYCPHCAEAVKPRAKVCKHCHSPL